MTTATLIPCEELDVAPILAAQVTCRTASDPQAISSAMGEAFGSLMAYMGRNALSPLGPPRAIYTNFDPEHATFILAMPVAAGSVAREADGGQVAPLQGGRAMRFVHRGPYREIMRTYGAIQEYLAARGLYKSEADWARYCPMWEEYLNDPETTPEPELLTNIYLPVRE